MSLPSDILNDLIALDLPAKKFAGVLAIVARLIEPVEDKRKRDRERKRNVRGHSLEIPHEMKDGNSAEIPQATPFPKQKVSPVTPSKTQPLIPDRQRAREVHEGFLSLIGGDLDYAARYGTLHQIDALLVRGFSRETILAGTARAMAGKNTPPNWTYFSKVIETENDERSAPAKPELRNGKAGDVIAAADRQIERIRDFERPPPEEPGELRIGTGAPPLRAISQG